MKNYPKKLWGSGYTIRCGDVNTWWHNSYQLCARSNKAGEVIFRRVYNYSKGQDTPWVRCISLDEANKLIDYLKSNEPIIAQEGLTPVKSGTTKVLNFVGTVTDTFSKEDLPIYVANGGYNRSDATHSLDPKSGKIIKNALVSASFPNITNNEEINNTGVNIFEIEDEADLKDRIKKRIKKDHVPYGFFDDVEKQISDTIPTLGKSPKDKYHKVVYKDKGFFIQMYPESSVSLGMNNSGTLSARLWVESDLEDSISNQEFNNISKDIRKYVQNNFNTFLDSYSYGSTIRLENELFYKKVAENILNKLLANVTIDPNIDTAGFVKLFEAIEKQYLVELKKSLPINELSNELKTMVDNFIRISKGIVANFGEGDAIIESAASELDRKDLDKYSLEKKVSNEALNHMVTVDIYFNVIPKCFDQNKSIQKFYDKEKLDPEDPRWLKIIFVSNNNRATVDLIRNLKERRYEAKLSDDKLDGWKDVIEVDISNLQYEEDSMIEELLDYDLDEDYKWVFDTIRVYVIDIYNGSSWDQELEMINNSIHDTINDYRKTLGRGYKIEYLGPGRMHRNKAITEDNDPDIDLIWTSQDGSKAYRVFTNDGFNKLNVELGNELKPAFDECQYIVLKETSGKVYLIELGSDTNGGKAVYDMLEANHENLRLYRPIFSDLVNLITDKNLLDILNACSAEIYDPASYDGNMVELAQKFYNKFNTESKLEDARNVILDLIDIGREIEPWDYDTVSETIYVQKLVESEDDFAEDLIDLKRYIENESNGVTELLPKINSLIDIFDKGLATHEYIESKELN